MATTPPQTVLVTGAGGFVGRHLCKALAAQGHEVRQVMRSGAGDGLWHVADIAEHDIPDAAISGVDVLVHLAASLPGQPDDPTGDKTQQMAKRVARTARLHGVRRVIHLSSVAARLVEAGDPKARDYGVQKFQAEQAFAHGLGQDTQLVTLRPPVIYGSGAKGSFAALKKLVASGKPLPFGRATQGRCYLSVGNLSALITTLVGAGERRWSDADRETFEPCDGSPTSTKDLVLMIANALKMRPWIISFPPALLRLIGKATAKQDQIDAIFEPLICREEPSLDAAFGWVPHEEMPESLSWISEQ